MKINLLLIHEVDWLHVVLAVALVIAVVSRFRTTHHRRFTISFTMKREKDDASSTEGKNVTEQQHDLDEGDEIIPQ